MLIILSNTQYPAQPYSRVLLSEMLTIAPIFRSLRRVESMDCFSSPMYSSPAKISTG